MVNINKLKGLITEAGKTQSQFAKDVGISQSSWSRKMSGLNDFTIREAEAICRALNISDGKLKADIFLS